MKRKILGRVCFFLLTLTLLLSSFASASVDKAYQTYTYSSTGVSQASPDAYSPSQRMIEFGEWKGNPVRLNQPQDLFVDDENNIIISDTANNRIVVLDKDLKLVTVIDSFKDDTGAESTFLTPLGVYRHTDGRLFVCDSENNRIVVFDENWKFDRYILSPDPSTMYDGFTFSPKSVAIDSTGRLNVVCQNETMGILAMSEDSEFEGFIGAISVTPSASEIFWRLFMTEEQIAQSIQLVPSPYNNIAVDSRGFIYATSSSMTTSEVYALVQSQDTSSSKSPVKRFTPSGEDVLRRTGHFAPLGDLEFPFTNTTTDIGASTIEDVAIGENDIYTLLDSRHNKLFTYDGDGNLLYAFGGTGSSLGNFTQIVAVDYMGKNLVVLDKSGSSVTLFTQTEYGQLIDQVISLQSQRKYTETIPIWEEIRAANNNFDLAYVGIGKSLLQQGKYQEAMDCFYAADVPEQYSIAMKSARAEGLENFAILIPIVIIVLVVVLVKIFAMARAYNSREALAGGPHSTRSALVYGLYVIFRPFDGFWDIKHEKRGNLRAALIILAVLLISAVASTPITAYLFRGSNTLESSFFQDLLNILLPLLLWCIANWCLTSLMDGKGTFKDIFISICYATIPLCFFMLPAALLSNALILDEAMIVTYMMNIGYVWTGILIVASSMTVHSYSFGKNILVCLLTIVGMGIILFLAMLFLSVSNRMISFISGLISEISIRL